jgi:glucose/arabinose dehydrogenase
MRCAFVLLFALGCGSGGGTPDAGGDAAPLPALRLEMVAQGFTKPVLVLWPPGDDRMFVVEHNGLVKIVKDGVTHATPFLDIVAQVAGGDPGSEERGLEGMTFHPEFATNRRFYLNFVAQASGDTRVVEGTAMAGDPDVADPTINDVLVVDQPNQGNHKGGSIEFSPRDGQLYIAVGDGGGSFDPDGNGQDTQVRLGKILRVTPTPGGGFTVPNGNPFNGTNGLREIWSYGLRNPWRMSFDRETGDLYIGDVGQGRFEEVDVQLNGEAGENYGWDTVEGKNHCPTGSDPCSVPGAKQPVHDYPRDVGTCIIGGHVYRGSAVPALVGHYFFADFGSALVRSFRFDRTTGQVDQITDWPSLSRNGITSFGQDEDGEIYVVTGAGAIFRIAAQ